MYTRIFEKKNEFVLLKSFLKYNVLIIPKTFISFSLIFFSILMKSHDIII